MTLTFIHNWKGRIMAYQEFFHTLIDYCFKSPQKGTSGHLSH
jgi:hypothetical protein